MHPLTIALLIYSGFSIFVELVETTTDHSNLSYFITYGALLAIFAYVAFYKSKLGSLGMTVFFGLQVLSVSLPAWVYYFVYGPSFFLSGSISGVGISVNVFALVAFLVALYVYWRK